MYLITHQIYKLKQLDMQSKNKEQNESAKNLIKRLNFLKKVYRRWKLKSVILSLRSHSL